MSSFTIGIKLGDGSFYPVLEEGFAGKKRFVLSTVHDNQESMQIDFYRNSDGDIESAEYIGSLMIEEITPAPKGDPEIEVILGLDNDNKLNAVAKNLASDDKQTLSVVLESLEGDSIYGMPEFEIDEEIETTEVMDDGAGLDDDSITGDTYPFEEEDRRKTLMKKKKNPLFLILFVLVGLIGVAGLLILAYWFFTTIGIIEKKPLDSGAAGDPTEIEADEETGDNDVADDEEETVDSGTGTIDSDETESPGDEESETTIADESASGDDTETDKKTEPIKTGFYYRIKKGDTLWDIAANFYRDPFQWYKIYREPRNKIKDPDLIFAGSRLYIPEN